ncbi:golgin-84 [Adelges cooleyi]|uniref:golgin-84 n=1 Tax=Adelges cooleyi TaxID=133065 RepID=UPI0021800E09|nr:golgin-84 [Adelges cooleyi]
MSWLKDLAGRAEQYLDKIDQSTAVVLQTQKEKLEKDIFQVPSVTENVSIEIDNKPVALIPSSPATKSLMKKPKQDARVSDEHLLQYLNGQETTIKSQYEGYSIGVSSNDSISVSLTEENLMLKNEIKTLNNEMSLLQYKLKTADKDISQITTALEINKRHSVNLEKELEEAQIQLKNIQDVMFNLKTKSANSREQTIDEGHINFNNNLVEENELLKQEVSKLIKIIEVDEHKKDALAAEKLNLEIALNNIQFQNKSSVQCEKLLNLFINECDAIVINSKSDLGNVSQKIKESLDELEMIYVQTTNQDGTANDLELKRTSTLAKLNSMKSSLLSIDCGVQKSFHDIVNFKERLTNLKVESAIENTSYNSCANQKDYNNEQMMSLQNALTCKQSEIDQVLAEKKAMAIQIESLEARLKKETSLLINVNDTDDAKAKVPKFMLENAFNTGVARRVKRAFSSIDSIGLRTGMYLRRYPLLRTLLFVYVVILHFWVMLILFSYTPETN